MNDNEFKYWLAKDPRMVIDKISLGSYNSENSKPVLEFDPYLNEYFLLPDAEEKPAYQYYLEYIGKSIFPDANAAASNDFMKPKPPDMESILNEKSSGIQKTSAYHELLFKILADNEDWNRAIKINECNTKFSIYTCGCNPFEKNHSVDRRGNSCGDKLCPRCAKKIQIRETEKAMKKFGCTGSLFISYEFTIPRELWNKIDYHQGIHKPTKTRCGKCGSETEINDIRYGKDHRIRKCKKCGWIGRDDQCIGEFFHLEDSGINRFCHVVRNTLKKFHGGQVGGFMAIHTFSSTSLGWKPHIHILITNKVIMNKDPLEIKKIKKWAEAADLDRLHEVYRDEFNREFGTAYERLVCNRGYVKKGKLQHRLRYMSRMPAQFIYEDKSGVYYNDHFKGLDSKLHQKSDELNATFALQKLVLDHIKRNGMYDRLMKYGDEGKSIINDYVGFTINAMDTGAGKVYLYDARTEKLQLQNLLFYENLIGHYWKRSAHTFRWIGWLSNSTWRYWVKRFKMPYSDELEERTMCKCGSELMFVGIRDHNGWFHLVREMEDIMPDSITIHHHAAIEGEASDD